MAITKFSPTIAVNSGQVLQTNKIPDEDKVMLAPIYYLESVNDQTPKTIASGIHQVGFINL